ncbi:MAG: hypothetical protein ACKOTZ_07575 [Chloroflexota bacterium]
MRRGRTLLAAAIPVALLLAGIPGPVVHAGDTCSIRNVRTGSTSTDLPSALGGVRLTLDPAKADTLRVTGTCTGSTSVGIVSVHIVGVRTEASGIPTLDGGGTGRVLRVGPGTTVTLTGLTLAGGDADAVGVSPSTGDGGGLLVEGTAILRDVVVRDNRAVRGGGIAVTGADARLRIGGRSSIRDNAVQDTTDADDSGLGGGIHAGPGTQVRVAGRTRIGGNTSSRWGGAIGADRATIVIGGRVSIDRNVAAAGAAIALAGKLVLTGRARIHRNAVADVDFDGSIVEVGWCSSVASTLILRRSSRITENTAAVSGAAVMLWRDGDPAAVTGRNGRVVGNTPRDVGTRWGAGC